MVKQVRHIITEAERNNIRSLYGLKSKKDYVFDFVLTENNKYVILMDQVFVEGGNGKSIGSIWDNTHIFTEILKESVSKIETITESVKEEITNIFESYTWTKEEIFKWVNEPNMINESWWDDIKKAGSNVWSGVKQVGGKILSGISSLAMSAFKNGILPFMRWIRRNATTNIGIVIDVAVAILSFKSSALIWAVIVLIDIYEIATGDYDPQEPERQQMPFFYLISDLLAVVLTAASALIFRKAIPIIVKSGQKGANSTILGFMKTILNKLPGVKNTLKSVLETLKKVFPSAGNITSSIGRGIDNVLLKLEQFIKKLFPALVGGVVGLGIVKGTQALIGAADPEGKLGQKVQKIDKTLQQTAAKMTGNQNIGQLTVDDKSAKAIDAAIDRYYAKNP
jgi:hypothetical protein